MFYNRENSQLQRQKTSRGQIRAFGQNVCHRRLKARRIFIAFWLWYCLWSGLSVPLFSQDYRTFRQELEIIKQGARWRFGPLWIVPSLQLDLDYDSNVYSATQGPRLISDYVATLSVPLGFYLLHREWLVFSLLASPQYVYFINTAAERALNISYTPALKLLLLRRFALSGSYQHSRSKARWLLELDSRVVQEINGWSGNLFYETIRNTAVGFSWSDLRTSYEGIIAPGSNNSLSQGLNRREKSGRAEFYYSVFSESFFSLNAGWTDYIFDDPSASFKDSTAYDFNLGIRFPLVGRIRGTLSIGYKKYIPRQEGQDQFSGIVGNGNLELRLGRLNLRVLYLRDIPFSSDLESIFFETDKYGAGISFYPTPGLRLDYDFSFGENVYPEQEVDLLADGRNQAFQRRDVYRTHSGNIVFRILRSTGIGLTVNYSERVSNLYSGEIERLMAGAFITYDF